MKLAEIFMEESGPKGRHFPVGFIPQALQLYEQAAKRERWGDNLTGKQNSLMTVRKSRSGLPSLTTADDSHPDCLLSLLLSLIRSAKLRSPDCLLSHLCDQVTKQRQARS